MSAEVVARGAWAEQRAAAESPAELRGVAQELVDSCQ